MKQQSPLLRIWELGEKEHGRLIGAIVLAAVGVIGGMVPYFAAAKMVALLMSGERDLSVYLIWGGAAMAGYAAKTLLYTFALSLSHAATFAVLKEIRQKILEKLPRLPLGTVIDTSSGKLKQIVVDQVDGMETTLAHLLPCLLYTSTGECRHGNRGSKDRKRQRKCCGRRNHIDRVGAVYRIGRRRAARDYRQLQRDQHGQHHGTD